MMKFFNSSRFAYGFFYFFIFLIAIYLLSLQVSAQISSDTLAHIGFAKDYFDGTKYIPHPLWHIFVHYLSYITMNAHVAATLVTATLIVFWLYLLHAVLHYFICEIQQCNMSTATTIFILSIMFFIGPAYLPFFSQGVYMGTWTPNVWHNVTMFTVKPFALLTVFFTLLALQRENKQFYFLSIFFLIISMFAKPSFAIVFIPALLTFFVLKRRYTKVSFIFVLTMFIVFIGVALIQFMNTYGGDGGKIIIDIFGVWSLYTSNIFISIIIGLFFPIIFFILNPKLSLKDDWIFFSWIMMVVSTIIFITFAEEGKRYAHANFGWSYMISMSLLYLFTIIKFVEIFNRLSQYKKIILSSILLGQFAIGIYFLVQTLMG